MAKGIWKSLAVVLVAVLCVLPQGCSKSDSSEVTIGFVTNNASPFWTIARAGVEAAAKEYNVKVDFQMPADDAAQKSIVEAFLAKGHAGIAICPNHPTNQITLIDEAAKKVPVICFDSDSPGSKRLAYVGTVNYKAGIEAGKLIKEVLPEGGKIMLFVGKLDAQNAKERKAGIEEAIKGTKITIIDTATDNADHGKAKSNAEAAISTHEDMACMVGLWSYNGPAILNAVKASGKKIPIVCFDEADETLQGVKDGHIHGTVVQDPYRFGYDSIKLLAALARKEDVKIPEDKVIAIPVKVIKKDGVDAFWADLKEKQGKK
jgi:ribose transport system substrate-binding protein